jgi:hypothetical protein
VSHVRQQIRERVRDDLAALASLPDRVFLSRSYPTAEAQLPCALIYAQAEEVEFLDVAGRQARQLSLIVEIVARQGDSADTVVDQVCAEVEAAIAADYTLGGVAKGANLAGAEFGRAAGSAPVHWARLRFVVVYHTSFADPQSAL